MCASIGTRGGGARIGGEEGCGAGEGRAIEHGGALDRGEHHLRSVYLLTFSREVFAYTDCLGTYVVR